MRVVVLHLDLALQAPPEVEDSLLTARQIAQILKARGHETFLVPFNVDYAAFKASVSAHQPDIVFNMVEHALGQDQLSCVGPAYLEQMAMPYTGSGAASFVSTCDKPFAKEILRFAGLPTPAWSVGPAWEGLDPAARYIVKSSTEDASLGLDDEAVVTGDKVKARAQACFEKFGGRWFAEAYIEGREFNISILEEKGGSYRVLPIAEMLFENWREGKARIVGYNAKWNDTSEESTHTARRFGLEDDEPALAAELIRLTRVTSKLFGIRGFARVDFRVDAAGNPLVLEVNPNPAIDQDAGFAAAAERAGMPYPVVLEKLMEAALP